MRPADYRIAPVLPLSSSHRLRTRPIAVRNKAVVFIGVCWNKVSRDIGVGDGCALSFGKGVIIIRGSGDSDKFGTS